MPKTATMTAMYARMTTTRSRYSLPVPTIPSAGATCLMIAERMNSTAAAIPASPPALTTFVDMIIPSVFDGAVHDTPASIYAFAAVSPAALLPRTNRTGNEKDEREGREEAGPPGSSAEVGPSAPSRTLSEVAARVGANGRPSATTYQPSPTRQRTILRNRSIRPALPESGPARQEGAETGDGIGEAAHRVENPRPPGQRVRH